MQIYNENMHMFMQQCQLQKTLNREAKEFKPLKTQASQKCHYINVNYCYKKNKALKQIVFPKILKSKYLKQLCPNIHQPSEPMPWGGVGEGKIILG